MGIMCKKKLSNKDKKYVYDVRLADWKKTNKEKDTKTNKVHHNS